MPAADPDIHYLTPADLYSAAEDALGRRPDVRDRRLLRSAAARPMLAAFGAEAYPTLIDKAAALFHAVAAFHLFYDGNKRAATTAVTRFLRLNGIEPDWQGDEVRAFVLEIAQDRHTVESVADWLAAHTRPAAHPPASAHEGADADA